MNAPTIHVRRVLAGVLVDDLKEAGRWYAMILGREADAAPMGGLLEWHFSAEAWLQVVEVQKVREVQANPGWGAAGSSSVSFVIDSLDQQLQLLAANHVELISKFTSNAELKTATVSDPFGNYVTFVEQALE